MIYLDYSANTPADPRVLETFVRVEAEFVGNPNSVHPAGRAASDEMARATERIAELLGANPAEVIYTSGASEANNLAIKGIAHAARNMGWHVISTPLEHASVSGCLNWLQAKGWEIDLLDVDRDGRIDLEQLRELLRDDTALVAVSRVDSELGTVQPVEDVIEILKGFPRCRLHVDATQAVGKMDVAFVEGIDTMSLAPHKFYGLNGSGVLLKRRGLEIEPLIHGGAGATAYRSGTPTLALAAAAARALVIAVDELDARVEIVRERNAWLRGELGARKMVRINSPRGAVPHILNVSVNGVKATAFQRALGERGVCVSVKSACSTEGTPSKAVYAVSRDRRNALSSWRISLSHRTTEAELREFMEIFDDCCGELVK